MEEATDLILKEDEELTSIQQLQKNRSITHLSSLHPSIKVPVRLWRPLLILVASVLAYVLINNFSVRESELKKNVDSKSQSAQFQLHHR
jgi:hypothetical protein